MVNVAGPLNKRSAGGLKFEPRRFPVIVAFAVCIQGSAEHAVKPEGSEYVLDRGLLHALVAPCVGRWCMLLNSGLSRAEPLNLFSNIVYSADGNSPPPVRRLISPCTNLATFSVPSTIAGIPALLDRPRHSPIRSVASMAQECLMASRPPCRSATMSRADPRPVRTGCYNFPIRMSCFAEYLLESPSGHPAKRTTRSH